MAIKKELLQGLARTISGSPEELYAKGILKKRPYPGGLSLAMRHKLGIENLTPDTKQEKRARKRARINAILARRQEE